MASLTRELETQVADWREAEKSRESHVTELNVKIAQYERLVLSLRNEIHVTEQKFNVSITESSTHLQQQIQVRLAE